jgi:hypothetical protein
MATQEPINTGETTVGMDEHTPSGQELLGHAGGPTEADFGQLADQYYPVTSLGQWERGPTGRSTAARLGVEEGIGGLGRPEYATFAPSNVLMKQAIERVPAFSRFANMKIERPTAYDIYGEPGNTGGGYQPSSGRVVIGRGAEAAGEPAADIALHELTHKASTEIGSWAADGGTGFYRLRDLYRSERGSLSSLGSLGSRADEFAQNGDWPHVFTTLAKAAMNGEPLPPGLASYFAAMRATR